MSITDNGRDRERVRASGVERRQEKQGGWKEIPTVLAARNLVHVFRSNTQHYHHPCLKIEN